MRKLVKKRSHKAGLPPGTLVHIGNKKVEKATVSVIVYDQSGSSEIKLTSLEEYMPESVTSGKAGGLKYVNRSKRLKPGAT